MRKNEIKKYTSKKKNLFEFWQRWIRLRNNYNLGIASTGNHAFDIIKQKIYNDESVQPTIHIHRILELIIH